MNGAAIEFFKRCRFYYERNDYGCGSHLYPSLANSSELFERESKTLIKQYLEELE